MGVNVTLLLRRVSVSGIVKFPLKHEKTATAKLDSVIHNCLFNRHLQIN